MINFKAVGQRIRTFRKDNGYTQEKLAELLDISTEHLSRIETGSYRPGIGLIEKLCTIFGIGEEELLFGTKNCDGTDRTLLNRIECLSDEKKKALLMIIDLIS